MAKYSKTRHFIPVIIIPSKVATGNQVQTQAQSKALYNMSHVNRLT